MAGYWITTDNTGYIYNEEDNTIIDGKNTIYTVHKIRTVNETTEYLIYRCMNVHEGKSITPISLVFEKHEDMENNPGFALKFSNFSDLRDSYESDGTHAYSYLLIDKDTQLNCSNILF
jgi:hypothetical protein